MKMKSLGCLASAARALLITSGTNASPIVATITAGHRQRNGSRIAIAGVTTLTAMNGEWTISAVAATTVSLDGSVGNGAFAGTAVVAAICDQTPFLPRNSALATVHDMGLAAIGVATIVLEGADSLDATQFYYTNSSGVATAGFKDSLLSGEIAILAQTVVGGGSCWVEVALSRYMTMRASAHTTGTFQGALVA